MARRSGLGKGLSSLIPMDGVSADGAVAELKELPTSAVTPNPNQPRRHFDEEALVELSASIAEMAICSGVTIRAMMLPCKAMASLLFRATVSMV